MRRYRSKTAVVWLAIIGGCFGLHRFYLAGPRDLPAWLFPGPTLLGLAGVHRMVGLGQDDRLAWLLMPLFGLSISAAMLSAIVYALTPDERWDASRNPEHLARSTRWGPVLGAILALLLGAAVFMSTVAFGVQKLFEAQL